MSNGENIPKSLRLRVISPVKLLADVDVREVYLPGIEGELGILPGHSPVVIALGNGDLTFRQTQQEEKIPIHGGYAEITADSVLVFSGKPVSESDGAL